MSESVKERIKTLPDIITKRELKPLLDAIVTDLDAHRASIVGITAKLDADAGVTDTNYAALWDPAANSLTS